MNITFVCQSCEDSFEFEYTQLSEATKGIKCPNCSKRLPPADVDELVMSLDDVLEAVAGMKKRFAVSFDVDSDDLPAQFSANARRGVDEDDEDLDDADDDDEDADIEDEDDSDDDDDL